MAMALAEDMRTAVQIKVGLSSYLTSGALAVLGAEAVIVTFVLDKREHLLWFYVAGAAGFAMLVYSMVLGSKGIAEAYKDGFQGNWKLDSSKGQFNRQAICALLGVVFVFASVLAGTPKQDVTRENPETLRRVG